MPAPGSASATAKPTKPLKSTNWSGYVDSGRHSRFTAVSGSWTVPAVRPGPAGYSSSWVGIDGATNQRLVQAGTEQDWSPDGVVYYAWYELIPSASLYLGQVFPGDHIHVQLAHVGDAAWTVTVDDSTQGTVWSGAVSYSAPGTSAEWIEEAPTSSANLKLFPLANFGAIQFSELGVNGPGAAQATIAPVYMVTKRHGPVRAYPGTYDAASDSFAISYGAAKATAYPSVPLAPAPATAPVTTTTTLPAFGTPPAAPGYWLAGLDGGVYSFGSAGYFGSAANLGLGSGSSAVTGIAGTPDRRGYWLATLSGGVFPLGDAHYYGSLVSLGGQLQPIVGIAATPGGKGYYMVGVSGGVFAFGDARYAGSCGTTKKCSGPTVAIVLDPTGKGYWLLQSDCVMVPFGDAPAIPATDCHAMSAGSSDPARTAVATPDGKGYWVVLQDGAIYAEGDARYLGSWPSEARPVSKQPAQALVPTVDGRGAWLVFANGTVEALGDAPVLGNLAGIKINAPVYAAAAS